MNSFKTKKDRLPDYLLQFFFFTNSLISDIFNSPISSISREECSYLFHKRD